MACKTDNFKFDPDKTALENLFALIFRTNRIRLSSRDLDVGAPRAIEPDEHGDNTVIKVSGKVNGPVKGDADLYYARADIDTHYPVFEIDAAKAPLIDGKEALIRYLDGKFNLVDGEFDVDIDHPFDSLAQFLEIEIFAKDTSYIYIGRKTIHIFWSEAVRRITDEGIIRVTDEGQVRGVPIEDFQ